MYVKTYAYTTGTLGTPLTTQNYTYNSQNQRTDLSYDAYGNMTALNGYSFTWANRRLTSATSADKSISYTYNHSGIRTSKIINGITTYYEVGDNNNVVKQYELVDGVETNVIEFVYGSDGSPVYFTYNNATYYYEKNMQGDIVGILDANGNTVVEYSYDIWGKLLGITGSLSSTIGQINPLRYRGYYYDTETSLYYLQSRYYSPDLMRFISQDDPVFSNAQGAPLGSNLYAYCLNNPVMNSDPTGYNTAVISAFFLKYGAMSSGWLLTAKLTAFISSVAPYLLVAVAVVITAYLTYKVVQLAKIKSAQKKIPNSLKTKDGKVDLSLFKTKLPGNGGWRGPNGWRIVKDTAKHAGSVWKLLDRAGKRIATLWGDGSVRGN